MAIIVFVGHWKQLLRRSVDTFYSQKSKLRIGRRAIAFIETGILDDYCLLFNSGFTLMSLRYEGLTYVPTFCVVQPLRYTQMAHHLSWAF